MHKVEPEIYYRDIPKKFMAAAVLLLNDQSEILLVKPSYKTHWQFPGGIVEDNEPPHLAAKREALEEIGLDIVVGRMLCVDYRLAGPAPIPDSLQFVFAVDAWQGQIKVDGVEIVDHGFFPLEQAMQLLTTTLARRLKAAFNAHETSLTFYLYDGENPFGKSA